MPLNETKNMAKKKTKIIIPFDRYKENWLYMLSQANYFNQCGCRWCKELKHKATLLMNYLRVSWDFPSFDDKCDYWELEEGVQLYTDYFHCKLSCSIIIDVCESIRATGQYWSPERAYIRWYNLIKHE